MIGEIRVPPESTLVIKPGIVINFQGHYKFIVDSSATLLAAGTETDSIYFTAEDTATGWHGIRFLGADRKSRITYSRLEFVRATGGWPDVNGAAVFCYYSNPKIRNNTIIRNSARRGGGICCYSSNPNISNNTITGNSALQGGGIYCFRRSSPTISNNTITGNAAGEAGGGIYCSRYSNPFINSNTLSGNSAGDAGGGIYCVDSSPTITNSVLWGDTAQNGPEIYVESGDPIVTYCDVQGDWLGEGNLDVHPLFRDPQDGDFHLMALYCGDPYNSPCIDAGHPDSLDAVLDCFHGLGTDRSDIGAYGGRNSGWPTDVGDYGGGLATPKQFLLHQNYPNPFNARTTIRYQLPVNAQVKLELYNLLGERVATLADSKQQTGYRSVVWDASKVSSGLYFYRLTAEDFTETRRMMLVK